MTYGCIGERLGHSFSKEIHRQIGDYPYELAEIAPDSLAAFFERRDFCGINVTIPYKEAVLPLLDRISDTARAVGCVNTVVNRGGTLYGYNTDFDGLSRLAERVGADPAGKKVLILGTGGTAKTAESVMRAFGAARIVKVSRTGKDGAATYDEALCLHRDADLIVNATPCGMYPHPDAQPLPLDPFSRLRGVIDAIYNPLRSRLVLEARSRGIPAEGGLYMLAAQAVRASELFFGTEYPAGLTEQVYRRVLCAKENIVLIGMPGSGKSSVAALLGEKLSRPVYDTDRLIEEEAGMPIREIFRLHGEPFFREIESKVIQDLSGQGGSVIATGGGAVLRKENEIALCRNVRPFFLDRPPEALLPTDDRPLADSREKIEALYRERLPLYRAAADETVSVPGGAKDAAAEIERRWQN